MGKMILGSLCYSDIVAAAKAGHSAFSRSQKNDKVYFNVVVWENDEPDKLGNDFSIQLSSTKEKREAEGKTYVGNLKWKDRPGEQSRQEAPSGGISSGGDDDLPF